MCCVYPASSEPKKKSESRCEWLVQLFLKPSMENVLSIQIHLKKYFNLDSRAALCDWYPPEILTHQQKSCS